MPRIDNNYLNLCLNSYKADLRLVDPYRQSCALTGGLDLSVPRLIDQAEYVRVKNKAFKDVNNEFILPGDAAPEQRFEGHIVAWLLQREVGLEDFARYEIGGKRLSLDEILHKALSWFMDPTDAREPGRVRTKASYWRIRLLLVLLENIDQKKVKAILNRYKRFFDLGNIDLNGSRKEVIFKLLQLLEKKAAEFGDPILLAEIKTKLGIMLNEKGNYQEAKKYFKAAAEAAKAVVDNPDRYRQQHINNRVDLIVNRAWGTVNAYYQTAELHRVRSSAYKILAQTIMLQTNGGQEISIARLKEALELVKKAGAALNEPKGGKGSVYKYFAEIYSALDLQRMQADIFARMGLLLKDSCPDQSKAYIIKAELILKRIVDWKDKFAGDRLAVQKQKKNDWPVKLHPFASKEKGVALLSEWGADIIGNVYLAKARLLMSINPLDPAKPKKNLLEAKKYLDQAKLYLLKPDDHNFKSVLAEYTVRMQLDSSPRRLSPELLEAKKVLGSLPKGFVFSKLWLARIMMKEEKFAEARKFLLDMERDPANQEVLTPQLRSNISQGLAELALEDEDLLAAESLFQKAACYNPYNYYAQLGLADLANWSSRFKDANKIYSAVERDGVLPIDVTMRARLGLAEVALRLRTMDPGYDATPEANKVIDLARAILERSEETFMLERALESYTEAVVARKRGGEKLLARLREDLVNGNFNISRLIGTATALRDPELRERVKASLTLKIADGYIFIQKYLDANAILSGFEIKYKPVIDSKPMIGAHYYLSYGEHKYRLNQNDFAAVDAMHKAARIIFNPVEKNKDPYLASRVIMNLVDIHVNRDNFAEALVMIYNTLQQDPEKGLEQLGGLVKPGRYKAAQTEVAYDLQWDNVKAIYDRKNLGKKWVLFDRELRLKLAEIMIYTRNFAPAQELLLKLDQEISAPVAGIESLYAITLSLQKARIRIGLGNIFSQRKISIRKDEDFRQALRHFLEARDLIENKLTEGYPGQELVLAKTELYLNLANVYLYGAGCKDIKLAEEFYLQARDQAEEISGNDDLKNYHLSRIFLGMAKVAQDQDELHFEGKKRWPGDLLARSRQYADKIVRKTNFAYNQLITKDLRLNHQNLTFEWKNPIASAETSVINSNQRIERSSEMRTTLRLVEPLHLNNIFGLDNLELGAVFKTNTDINLHSGAGFQSYYFGLLLKPAYWLNAEADFKLPFLTHTVGSGDKHLKYLTNPDHSVALWLKLPTQLRGWRGLSATAVTELFRKETELNSVYANLMYNVGRDSTDPLLQGASAGAQFNYFKFPYDGLFPARLRLYAPTLKYEVDLKHFDLTESTRFTSDMLRLGFEAALIYEYATDPYRSGPKTILTDKDNLGFSAGANLLWNSGLFKLRVYYRYEGIWQDIKGLRPTTDKLLNNHQAGVLLERIF